MKTKFTDYLQQLEHSVMRISKEDAKQLLALSNDPFELRNFLKKNNDFPNINKIHNFVDWLDSYDNKIFEKWTNYVDIVFKKSDQFIYFDIEQKEEVYTNKSYKQWYNQLKNKKPTIVYLIDDSMMIDPTKVEKLYKLIKRIQVNKERTTTKKEPTESPQQSNLIKKLEDKIGKQITNPKKDNKSLFDSDISIERNKDTGADNNTYKKVVAKYKDLKKSTPQNEKPKDNKIDRVKAIKNKNK